MSQDNYSFDKINSYQDEFDNTITVYRVTDYSSGFSCVVEGIHEHKTKRKGIKKIKQLIKDQERSNRTKK